MTKKLEKYKKRRDLKKSREPKGARKSKKLKHPIFVIQKHKSRQLHYDLRIEIGGVLKSWAIPKGPSTDPRVKRLASPTDDHPLDYALFEGIIPKGHYGAGTVMVWDLGTYKNIHKEDGKLVPIKKCYKQGLITIEIKGKKIQGGYALVRIKGRTGQKEAWLFIKKRDAFADARRNPVSTQKNSVLTNRTMREITSESKK
jgi:DNA ligase D-like protein (predicted 3'-phosphoesterase)